MNELNVEFTEEDKRKCEEFNKRYTEKQIQQNIVMVYILATTDAETTVHGELELTPDEFLLLLPLINAINTGVYDFHVASWGLEETCDFCKYKIEGLKRKDEKRALELLASGMDQYDSYLGLAYVKKINFETVMKTYKKKQ